MRLANTPPAPVTTHQQLPTLVAERIRMAILGGDYEPGVWLRQQQLADDLGVSQMPVREALKKLALEGLVEYIPYKGARVLAISLEDVEDLYAQRIFLETRAARLAAEQITASELADLGRLHQEMANHQAAEQITQYRQLNRRFHEVIYAASRRQYLIRTLNQLWAAFPTMLWGNFAQTAAATLPNRDATDQEEHEAILIALTAHDGSAAEWALHNHLSSVAADLLTMLRNSQRVSGSQ
jgi:DNA-binding GntR family transcriptional regulator